jgi:hypothetical protein
MTEENPMQPETAEQPEPIEYIEVPDADWFLRDLVSMVNAVSNMSIDINLLVGGMVVSGELVSVAAYLNEFAESFGDAFKNWPEDIPEKIRTIYGHLAQRVTPIQGEHNPALDPERTNYIHIKNVKYFHPSGAPIPDNEGIWWRGKLSAVDGFTLGKITRFS